MSPRTAESFFCSSDIEPELSIMNRTSTLSTPDWGTSTDTPDTVHGVNGASSWLGHPNSTLDRAAGTNQPSLVGLTFIRISSPLLLGDSPAKRTGTAKKRATIQ